MFLGDNKNKKLKRQEKKKRKNNNQFSGYCILTWLIHKTLDDLMKKIKNGIFKVKCIVLN